MTKEEAFQMIIEQVVAEHDILTNPETNKEFKEKSKDYQEGYMDCLQFMSDSLMYLINEIPLKPLSSS